MEPCGFAAVGRMKRPRGSGMAEDETHLTRTEARAGSSTHVVRYILGVSLTLVVVLFALIVWLWH